MPELIFNEFAIASLPILIIAGVGFLCRQSIIQSDEVWNALDKVNFNILVPAMIFGTLVDADLAAISGGQIMLVIILALLVVSALLLGFQIWLVPKIISVSSFTSVFQTSTRWNAALALAVVGLLFEDRAITIVAIIMVALMPLVNVINIAVLVRLLTKENASLGPTITKILQNPIIISCVLGLAFSTIGPSLPKPVSDSFDILKVAAIGTLLLSLGAGLRVSALYGQATSLFLSSTLKLVVMPALVLLLGLLVQLDNSVLLIAVTATAMPTATNGFAIAKEMGGDAPLYAAACTLQTILSLITVPLWVFVCSWTLQISV